MANIKTEKEDHEEEETEHPEYCKDCDDHHYPLSACYGVIRTTPGLDEAIKSVKQKFRSLLK